MVHLDRVDARTKLKPRRDPYWQRLAQGRYIGFRRITKDSAGSWLARHYDGQSYQYSPLGEFSELPEKARFDAAKLAAEEWFSHLDKGGSNGRTTVKQACKAYIEKLRQDPKKGEAAVADTEGRFRRLVYDDPIGRVELAKLAPRHVADWKTRTLASGNSASSFNRNATALRAALNLAKSMREVASDHAWTEELKPYKDVNRRRELYLDRDARRALIESASDEVRPVLRALALVPMRPGETRVDPRSKTSMRATGNCVYATGRLAAA